jgi:hypothetical protein
MARANAVVRRTLEGRMTTRAPRRFPELEHQAREAERARQLLEHACSALDHADPDEDAGTKAQRLRGAAVVAQSALAELWTAVGWYEAARMAEQYGLLDDD